jgi:hypothetical protein
MGLLQFIFGKQIKIDHEFFGQMLFEEYKHEPAKNHFECRRPFQPSGKTIGITIEADITGLGLRQRRF